MDWRKSILRYDRPSTAFYCDPPCWQCEHYGIPFPWENHERMAELMRSIKGGMLVSINDHPDTREIFAGFPTEEIRIEYTLPNAHSGAKTHRTSELLVTNRDAPREAIKK